MSDVTVVVGTLDLYSMVWPGLCHGLKKYWSDCPWPVVFITNKMDAPYGQTIKVGGDHTDWTGRMRRGLRQIQSPVILWLTSDNWITGCPNTGALAEFANYILSGKSAHIWLYPGQDYDIVRKPFVSDGRLVVVTKKSPCRCSLKPSLWRRKVLLSLLREGEQAWDFERLASKRSRELGDSFLLYSVGDNLRDDGGKHDFKQGDIVWRVISKKMTVQNAFCNTLLLFSL